MVLPRRLPFYALVVFALIVAVAAAVTAVAYADADRAEEPPVERPENETGPTRTESFATPYVTRPPAGGGLPGAPSTEDATVAAVNQNTNATNNVANETAKLHGAVVNLTNVVREQTVEIQELRRSLEEQASAVTRLVAAIENIARAIIDAEWFVRAAVYVVVGSGVLVSTMAVALAIVKLWKALLAEQAFA